MDGGGGGYMDLPWWLKCPHWGNWWECCMGVYNKSIWENEVTGSPRGTNNMLHINEDFHFIWQCDAVIIKLLCAHTYEEYICACECGPHRLTGSLLALLLYASPVIYILFFHRVKSLHMRIQISWEYRNRAARGQLPVDCQLPSGRHAYIHINNPEWKYLQENVSTLPNYS